MRSWICLCAILLMMSGLSVSGDEAGDIYFKSGAEKYFGGDIESALKDLESGYLFDKNNAKLTAFYVKVLVERASACYQERKFNDAMTYISRAKEVLPGDAKVQEMYLIVSRAVKGPDSVVVKESKRSSGPARPSDMAILAQEFSKQQEKLVEAYVGPIRDLIEKNARNQEKFINRTFVFSIIGVILGIIVTVSLMYAILHYVSIRREAILIEQQERIVTKILAQNAVLNQLPFVHLPGTSQEGMQKILTEEHPQTRAMDVDIIEAEIVEDSGKDMAQRLLVPFLNDGDNRVRAKAAKAMFRFDRRLSLDTLIDMARNDDRWMRVSAAWALSEIMDDEAARVLLEMSSETEAHVKRMVLKGLQKVARNEEKKISPVVRDLLVKALDDIRKKEGWVV